MIEEKRQKLMVCTDQDQALAFEAILLPATSLRRVREHVHNDLRERVPDIFSGLQAPLQSLQEIAVSSFRCPSFGQGHLRRNAKALWRRTLVVPLQRVDAREEIAAKLAK